MFVRGQDGKVMFECKRGNQDVGIGNGLPLPVFPKTIPSAGLGGRWIWETRMLL